MLALLELADIPNTTDVDKLIDSIKIIALHEPNETDSVSRAVYEASTYHTTEVLIRAQLKQLCNNKKQNNKYK